jgi:hypothetical protein
LSELANADQLLLWGKITTTSTPYYIAIATDFKGQYSFPHKKFYYRLINNNVALTNSFSQNYPPSTNTIERKQITSIQLPSPVTHKLSFSTFSQRGSPNLLKRVPMTPNRRKQ